MELKRTTQNEVHKKAKDKIWDIKAVRDIECEKIKKELAAEAKKAINLGEVGNDKTKAKQYLDRAIEKYESLSHDLEQLYDPSLMGADYDLLRDAEAGVFKKRAPTNGSILFWMVALVLAGGLELLFFGYMIFFKGAGYGLIGIAVVLLVGGLFTGRGAAEIMIDTHKTGYENDSSEAEISKKHLILLIIGIVLIAGVTAMRWIYGGYLAGIVALFLGLAVTTTEAFGKYSKEIRYQFLDLMFIAQQRYAALQMKKDLREIGNPDDDEWKKHYIRYIKENIAGHDVFLQAEVNDQNVA